MLRKNVLRGERNFSAVYKHGKSAGSRYVVLFYKKNGLDYNRIAFLASKKVGNAVARKRARRLMKESVRSLGAFREQGYDIVFIARNTIVGRKCGEVKKSVSVAVRHSKLRFEAHGK